MRATVNDGDFEDGDFEDGDIFQQTLHQDHL
jgi:hypothetical protein